jgi:hypothetical protein
MIACTLSTAKRRTRSANGLAKLRASTWNSHHGAGAIAGRCGSTPPPTASRFQSEGPLHAPWALYKKDTAITAQKGEDWIKLFNAAADISS